MLASGLTDFVGDALDLQVQVDAIGLGAVFALMAVGIGLVFGVMRLVNFAYGQLIMAGAFALAYASDRDWPVGVGDRTLLRGRRSRSPSRWSASCSGRCARSPPRSC